jgi:hypothetical protein
MKEAVHEQVVPLLDPLAAAMYRIAVNNTSRSRCTGPLCLRHNDIKIQAVPGGVYGCCMPAPPQINWCLFNCKHDQVNPKRRIQEFL